MEWLLDLYSLRHFLLFDDDDVLTCCSRRRWPNSCSDGNTDSSHGEKYFTEVILSITKKRFASSAFYIPPRILTLSTILPYGRASTWTKICTYTCWVPLSCIARIRRTSDCPRLTRWSRIISSTRTFCIKPIVSRWAIRKLVGILIENRWWHQLERKKIALEWRE